VPCPTPCLVSPGLPVLRPLAAHYGPFPGSNGQASPASAAPDPPNLEAPMALRSRLRSLLATLPGRSALLVVAAGTPIAVSAQVPRVDEVRQIITFSFLPGRSAEAVAIFRDEALPLYRDNDAMRSFRGFREVESPIPLDLVVVSSFEGMAGMDASNDALRGLAAERGTSVGGIYEGISALSTSHTDQFAEIMPNLGRGDPAAAPLTAMVWYQIQPDSVETFETALIRLTAFEAADGVPSITGRMILSDGWDYVRFLGFESLGAYQDYWMTIRAARDYGLLAGATVRRREVILTRVPELDVR